MTQRVQWKKKYKELYKEYLGLGKSFSQAKSLLFEYMIVVGQGGADAFSEWHDEMSEENHLKFYEEVRKYEDSGDWRKFYEVKDQSPDDFEGDDTPKELPDDVDGGKSGG